MEIENKVDRLFYTAWIEKFVIDVLKKAKIKSQKVTIEDVEVGRRIFLNVDGNEYTIRTWDFDYTLKGENKRVVYYTLYVCEGNCGKDISSGTILIEF